MNTNKKYKDRLFRFIFSEKKRLLDLYNAVNGSGYTNEEDLEINTLEDIIYMGMKNDLSFVIDNRLNVYEHQSTYSPNMPLRGFLYTADLYRKILGEVNIYGSRLIKIPTPQYIVFYNGESGINDRIVLKLSEAFEKQDGPGCIEFEAVMLNINYGRNRELMEKCEMLQGYAIYVHKVRKYSKTAGIEKAVETAIKECIEENNPLSDLLRKHRAEVRNMTLTEYDEAKVMEQFREEGIEEGMEIGRAEGREEGKMELIHLMLQNNMSLQDISHATGLPVDKIKTILGN